LALRLISFLSISRSGEKATTAATVQQMNTATAPQFNAILRKLLRNTDAWKAKRRREIEASIAEELKRRRNSCRKNLERLFACAKGGQSVK